MAKRDKAEMEIEKKAGRPVAIGILGFQGDIEENLAAAKESLKQLNVSGTVTLVRYPEEIDQIDGLIIPGGESTVMSTLAALYKSLPVLKKRISNGMPVMGTCAGLIMLSHRAYDRVVGETKQKMIGNLDIVIERNAFGRQSESFEADLDIPVVGKEPFRAIFIRAPAVSEVGKDVQVLARLNDKVVAVKQKNIIGTAFHPELSDDLRLHKQFVSMVVEYWKEKGQRK